MQAIFITGRGPEYDAVMQTGRPSKRPRSAFGTRLHAAREAAGLTQAQVAQKLDLTQAAYALWERREMALKPEQIEQAAKVLGVSVDYLFGHSSSRVNGPVGKVRQTFESVSRLPRRQQQRIIGVVEDMLLARSTGH